MLIITTFQHIVRHDRTGDTIINHSDEQVLNQGNIFRRAFATLRNVEIAHDAVKFVVAGTTASGMNWLVRLAVSFLVPFPIALVIGAAVGMSISFALYRIWVFPRSAVKLHVQAALFLAVNAVTSCFLVGAALLIASLITDLPISTRNQQNLAHAIAIGVGGFVSFVGHRYFTFARRAHSRPDR